MSLARLRRSRLFEATGRASRRFLRAGAAVGVVAASSACSVLLSESEPQPQPSPGEVRFEAAVDALAEEDFVQAARDLRALAEDGSSGAVGREATLLWAFLELDPRYPAGSPDTAARLAAHYLQLPDAPPATHSLAETLYLLAVDLGAEPVDVEASEHRALPTHPGPGTWTSLTAALSEIEALRRQLDQLARERQDLARELEALEAELQRIRRLLLPGSGSPE